MERRPAVLRGASSLGEDGQLRIIDRVPYIGTLSDGAEVAAPASRAAQVPPLHQGSRGLRRRSRQGRAR